MSSESLAPASRLPRVPLETPARSRRPILEQAGRWAWQMVASLFREPAVLPREEPAEAPEGAGVEGRCLMQMCLPDRGGFGRALGAIHCIAFSPDGNQIAVGSSHPLPGGGGEVTVWEAATGRHLFTLPRRADEVRQVAFSPDGTLLAILGEEGGAHLWHMQENRQTAVLAPSSGAEAVNPSAELDERGWHLAFSPDGICLAVASPSEARVWDVASCRERICFSSVLGAVLITVSPEGAACAASPRLGSGDGRGVRQPAELPGAAAPAQRLRPHVPDPGVAFIADGAHLVLAASQGTVTVWDVQTGQLLHHRAAEAAARVVAFAPGGRLLAGTDEDYRYRLLDLQSGRQTFWSGHAGPIRGLAFSPDGKWLASAAGGTGTPAELLVWEVQKARLAFRLAGQSLAVGSIAFHPNGQTLAGAGHADELFAGELKLRALCDEPEAQQLPECAEAGAGDGAAALIHALTETARSGESPVPLVLPLLHAQDAQTRFQGAILLGRMGETAWPAAYALAAIACDPDEIVRLASVHALCQVGPHGHPVWVWPRSTSARRCGNSPLPGLPICPRRTKRQSPS